MKRREQQNLPCSKSHPADHGAPFDTVPLEVTRTASALKLSKLDGRMCNNDVFALEGPSLSH